MRFVKFLDWSVGAEPGDELRLKPAMKKDRHARLLCFGTVKKQSILLTLKQCEKHRWGVLAPTGSWTRNKEIEDEVEGHKESKTEILQTGRRLIY